MSTSGIFYVYEHWRLDRDECFYVGKGQGRRAYSNKDRNQHWLNIVSKLERIGSGYEIRLVATGLSEEEAFALEIERIAFWQDIVDLANLTNGGQGISGFKHSDETKAKLAEISRNQIPVRGWKHSEETKKILSEIGKKRGAPKLTPEQQKKSADTRRGRKMSDEARLKLSLAKKGKPSPKKGKPSPLKGIQLSAETKAKQSEVKKLWWAKKREENGGVLVGRKLTDIEKKNLSEKAKLRWQKIKQEQA